MAASSNGEASSWQLLALAMTMLLPSLGTSIANVALPSFETAFTATFSEVQWVVLSYLLAVTTMIVGVGRLGDLVGRRKLLLAGIAIFALASAAAVAAPNLWMLVTARAVQGLGAAIMMALTVALVSDVVPQERTGSAIGLLGTVSAIGTALGPSLGGALLAATGWPALFAVMATMATVTFFIVLQLLPKAPSTVPVGTSFDILGMTLLALSLGAYALSTTLGGAHPGFWNAGLAVFAVIGITAFVLVEGRTASPLIQLKLLRERGLSTSLVSLGLVSTIMMATLVVGPFYLSDVLGLTPVQTGFVMSTGPGVAALVGFPAGRSVDAYGTIRVTIAGLVGVAFGTALMTVLPGLFGTVGYITSFACITTGYALFLAANNTSVMASAPRERKGLTSALLGLFRNLGLITGASVMGAVFTLASNGLPVLGLATGRGTGLALTFIVAFLLASIALSISLRHARRLAQVGAH